ncbi:hypothetical protein ACEWY4_003917 [Coilia grayii]|uniref:BEN domain-containing protein n=1 Tax=Coilia grayii TaxID=363190 RepID=A0ABD1KK77_9TELE
MMSALFTREEMAMSSLTGKATNAFKNHEAKPQLDVKKVSAICSYINKEHGGLEAKEVLSIMRSKLNNEAKLYFKKKPHNDIQTFIQMP